MNVQRLHVVVTGRVQGVSFRESTRQVALSHGVDGWVRNLPDGSVEAIFEGSAATIEAMLQFVRVGPPSAKVEKVEVTLEEGEKQYQKFEIRR